MGTYVYTARATGRVKVMVDGGMHWVFPLKYSFKPHWFSHEWNDRMINAAHRQASRVENHKDWEGYVNFEGKVYKNGPTLYYDSEPWVWERVQ